MTTTRVVEAYWMPGCSSCLRMKEFISQSGKAWVAINVDERLEARMELADNGMRVPAARVGDRWVSGIDLAAVADLIGVPYDPPTLLPREQLAARYLAMVRIAGATIAQMTPEMLSYRLPNRNREMLDVANQVASVMRAFLTAYSDDRHAAVQYYDKPADVQTQRDLLARLEETERQFGVWWEEDGIDDPLDRVVPTSWGYPTLHEILEREVWHTAQHLRQLQHVLREFGVEPHDPLGEADLAGLPLPSGIHD